MTRRGVEVYVAVPADTCDTAGTGYGVTTCRNFKRRTCTCTTRGPNTVREDTREMDIFCRKVPVRNLPNLVMSKSRDSHIMVVLSCSNYIIHTWNTQ